MRTTNAASAERAAQITAMLLFTPLAVRMKARIHRRQDEPAVPIASQTVCEAALPRSEAGDGRPKAALLETTPDGGVGTEQPKRDIRPDPRTRGETWNG